MKVHSSVLQTSEDIARGYAVNSSRELDRVVRGYPVPLLSEEYVRSFFGIPEDDGMWTGQRSDWEWVIPLMATSVSTLKIMWRGKAFLSSTCDRIVQRLYSETSWVDMYRGIDFKIGGQVKNFLVAVRASSLLIGKNARVLIRGSKHSASSGVWIWLYADWLLQRNLDLEIDCYDDAEVAGVEQRSWEVGGQRRVATVRHHSCHYMGDASGYDLAIDDAYLDGTVPWVPKAYRWSLKDHSPGCLPFLHTSEGRVFSDAPTGFAEGCPCWECRVSAQSSLSYGEFLQLRGATAVLGGSRCRLFHHQDVRAKADLYKKLCSQPAVRLHAPEEMRAALALSTDVALVPAPGFVLKMGGIGEGTPFHIQHKVSFVGKLEIDERCARLEGKNVHFVGVSPSILGDTITKPGPWTDSSHVFAPDVLTLRNHQMTFQHVWLLHQDVVGYVPTGYSWNHYREYTRAWRDHDVPVVVYSGVVGEVLSEDDVWHRSVPGVYQATRKLMESYSVLPDVPIEGGPFRLHFPFLVSGGQVLPPCPRWDYVWDHSPLREGITAVHDVGGLKQLIWNPICFAQEGRGCTHDHLFREGQKDRYVENPRLHTVQIVDGPVSYEARVVGKVSQDICDELRSKRGRSVFDSGGSFILGEPV